MSVRWLRAGRLLVAAALVLGGSVSLSGCNSEEGTVGQGVGAGTQDRDEIRNQILNPGGEPTGPSDTKTKVAPKNASTTTPSQ